MSGNSIQTEDSLLQDLGMAYRKAKADLFYSPRCCRQELLTYEVNLDANLRALAEKIESGSQIITHERSWSLIPKGINTEESKAVLIDSNPASKWKALCESPGDITAEFRIMEQLPVEFHVFATYWIHRVGAKLDEKLHDFSFGNRLRRQAPENGQRLGELNLLSLGSNPRYLKQYREWQDQGLNAIEHALDDKKKVVAITADVAGFYHNLKPSFLKDDTFLATIGVELEPDERALNELFVQSLLAWAESTPLKKGLPVGLVASSVIANLALFELDKLIKEEISPLYYGRYVDDIILVIENTKHFESSEAVWEWITKRTGSSLKLVPDEKRSDEGEFYLDFCPEYLEGSSVHFKNEKNKIFTLSGSTGRNVLQNLKKAIQERSSEWRALPDVSQNEDELESKLITAIYEDKSDGGSLRKADEISIRRANFAIQLSNLEAFSRYLSPKDWRSVRHAFLDTVIAHIFVLPTFFDYFNYTTRLVRLALFCGDYGHVKKMEAALLIVTKGLRKCATEIKECESDVPAEDDIVDTFKKQLQLRLEESLRCVPIPSKLTKTQIKDFRAIATAINSKLEALPSDEIIKVYRGHHEQLQRADLGYLPLKAGLMGGRSEGAVTSCLGLNETKNPSLIPTKVAKSLVVEHVLDGVDSYFEVMNTHSGKDYPLGLLFPTRPFNVHDLYLIVSRPFDEANAEHITKILLAHRGFKSHDKLPLANTSESTSLHLEIQDTSLSRNKVRVAVTSWMTPINSWVANVTGRADPNRLSRLTRLCSLLNQLMRLREAPRYVVLPELSIPPAWFIPMAQKLKRRGICLIAGVEYVHDVSQDTVQNQVWAALSFDALDFPVMIPYVQDKQRPALGEEQELFSYGGKRMEPKATWKTPPVIKHGDFNFSLMICSEFTNINYRAALRGKVDALFVPQWNKDTESFNALVESAALDVHAYIVQCNDRSYGDSRIRVPYKDSWKRDLIRVKGGLEDYFVVGEIDVAALRAFQSSYRSPSKPFKPVPDGFNGDMAENRKTLPRAD